jgi:L-lactate dehydrogenase complex protein LldE
MAMVALFVPCFVDQFYPRVAIAAVQVLRRLGVDFDVPDSAVCCGQPAANAGFEGDGEAALARFARTYGPYDRVIVLSGSCAVHVRMHAKELRERDASTGARVGERTMEFCEFLHDAIGVDRVARLDLQLLRRTAIHIGCHALRGLGLALPSEIQAPPFDKVRALLETVRGLTFIDPARRDECCGFGGTFAVGEADVSAKMGRDRLRDYASHDAEMIVSTDVSCLMHMGGLARRNGMSLPMVHVAEVLAGTVEPVGPHIFGGQHAVASQ